MPPHVADDRPTVIRHDSSVRRVRSVDVLPKLVIQVVREPQRGERTFVHQGEVCRIGTHSSNHLVLVDPSGSFTEGNRQRRSRPLGAHAPPSSPHAAKTASLAERARATASFLASSFTPFSASRAAAPPCMTESRAACAVRMPDIAA